MVDFLTTVTIPQGGRGGADNGENKRCKKNNVKNECEERRRRKILEKMKGEEGRMVGIKISRKKGRKRKGYFMKQEEKMERRKYIRKDKGEQEQRQNKKLKKKPNKQMRRRRRRKRR